MKIVWISALGFLAAVGSAVAERPLRQHSTGLMSGAQDRPNIVVILADDFGYGDLGCFGNKFIQTPHLDRLAAEGVKLTGFYVSAPVCSPTRAALLTGRDPQRNGLPNVIETEDHTSHLSLDEFLLPEFLKKAGYATGIIGKWHIGETYPCRPTQRGFDSYFGGLLGGMDYFTHLFPTGEHDLWRNNEPVHRDGEYVTDLLGEEAESFVGAHRAEPFFLYLAFQAIHTAMSPDKTVNGKIQAPERWLAQYRQLEEPLRSYAAGVSAMDEAIGRLLTALDKHGLADSTFIFFTSDNGPLEKVGGTAAPYRDGKHTLWEGGVHVPAIARWPGRIPAGETRSQPAIGTDLFPTALALAGIEKPAELKLDGRNMLPLLMHNQPGAPRDLFWSYVRDTKRISREKSVRRGKWKWLNGELYDLKADPGETKNLAAKYPEKASELEQAWNLWAEQYPEETRRWNGRAASRNEKRKKS